MADPTATLDDVVTALETINTTLGTLKTSIDAVKTEVGKVKTSTDAVKTEITTQANAINTNNSYVGSGAAVDTNVDTNRVFVVAPWPPESEPEVEPDADDTDPDDTDPDDTVGE